MPLEPGQTHSVSLTVTDADTAGAFRSGEVPVLASPRLLALCEQATTELTIGELDPGQTTVGMRVQFDHVAPSAVGRTVTATAELQKIEGRRLTFSVEARDGEQALGCLLYTSDAADD
mgnify:CR=1 FL=1